MNSDILIFILDDDEDEANEIGLLLKENNFLNYKIFTVSVEMLQNISSKNRIFIIDYRLDMLNGLEVIEKIRNIVPHCYFIMLSGMKNYAVVEQFNNTVIRGKYLTKGEPGTNKKIIQFINEFIEDMKMMEVFYREKDELQQSVAEIKKIIGKR